jgi:hypothetical protein
VTKYYIIVGCCNCKRSQDDYICNTYNRHNRQGVFKKRPNFLNSAPTSAESALRLLRAPSVRFWLQTAICPVSTWALVVELNPLNWARAQAVCRISDKVTMKELEEQRARACVCVGASVWNFAANSVKILETFQLLNQADVEDCMSRTQCYEWFKRFKGGRTSVGEDRRPGRPSTSTNDGYVERVRVVIRGNRRLLTDDQKDIR